MPILYAYQGIRRLLRNSDRQVAEIGRAIMDRPGRPPGNFPPEPGPVPAVDAADPQAMWNFQDDLQARHPGQSFSVSASSYQRILRPDADVTAVWYRLSILRLLQQTSKMGALQLPWLPDGKPSDAVFQALAVVRMTGLAVGTPTDTLPVDLDELARRIQKDATSGTQES